MSECMVLAGMAACAVPGFLASLFLIGVLNKVDKAIIGKGTDRKAGYSLNMLSGFLSALTFLVCGDLRAMPGCLFWASLSAAAYSDLLTKEIFDWVYLPGAAGCAALMAFLRPEGVLVELLIFIGLQAVIFRRMYGGSDCIAFSMCALFFACLGLHILEYTLVMLLTMILFTLWQWLIKNINRTFTRLKTPDAMIPYIFGAMALFMLYMAVPFVYAAVVLVVVFILAYVLL